MIGLSIEYMCVLSFVSVLSAQINDDGYEIRLTFGMHKIITSYQVASFLPDIVKNIEISLNYNYLEVPL